ncbi:chemotaxis protein CheB [Scytonema hofmannii PCC 7110]|uniref:protein-glutamate methylesterase n=1 Tax=Scytonema hofmannii PCC 7110 TaxID=128403 RepID=A0A139XAK4_9CYAN|nr:chemotaxis protein CheB [Scytonema hofmannii]KYC41721.1 chemotaxis protein CheB [Scytonema hofmannii PCC 7110]
MLKPDIIVVGASAGGLKAFEILVSQMLSNFPAAVFIVWHVSPDYPSMLPDILARFTSLPVAHAVDNEPIKTGRIYVAPPDRHLLVEPGVVRLSRGPKENRFRPAVDVLFRSAAWSYGSRVIGVVLSGSLDDGAAGLYAIKERGGIAVVQDPSDALFSSMPRAALKAVAVDHCVPIIEMGALLAHLVNKAIPEQEENLVSEKMDIEVGVARQDNALELGIMKLGDLSPFTCPECHGVLLQLKEGNLLRFRCHTGHAYSLNALLAEVTQSIEESLWDGIRTIEASEMLMTHTAKHLREMNEHEAADLLLQKAEDAKRRGDLVRQAVMSNEILSQENLEREIKLNEEKQGF